MRARRLVTPLLAIVATAAFPVRSGAAPAAEDPALTRAHPAPRERPNVILIVVDTLRVDHLGSYGYERPTSPNLDRFAESAVRYERAFSQAPWTTPSVGSLLTSRFPTELGTITLRQELPDRALLVSEVLQQNGYATGAVVSHTLCGSFVNFDQGFDVFDDEEGQNFRGERLPTSVGVTDRALAFATAQGRKPYFLWAHYFDPHWDYLAHPEFEFSSPPVPSPSVPSQPSSVPPIIPTGKWKELLEMLPRLGPAEIAAVRDLYDSEIAFTDHQVGRLLEGLAALGQLEGAVIVITADHGEEFLDHGGIGHTRTLYDELIHVPLFVRYPDGRRGAAADPVALLDIFPTILDVAGIPRPGGLRGRSLVGGDAGTRAGRLVFAETSRGERLRSVRSATYKLVHQDGTGREQLFDLLSDPGEQVDVLVRRPGITAYLRRVLDRWHRGAESRAFTTKKARIDAEQRQRLEALGYVESP
jgi:arylsulfatase A-like enzyme